ncbi:Pvc16 family protein [Baaleninema simplex]|uniref:Pvc16 family protein n=1 Tax=Baaleninema simplex TaxID=2862350 RepID=UPI00130E8E07|nr:Pvc16 family protein [Baaleninema simplex]
MTNHLAIATVTMALSNILVDELSHELPDLTITMDRPDAPTTNPPKTRINIYLYHAAANPAWRNADLRTRRPKGDLIKHGQAGLDLNYLLTFYGDPATL